MNRLLLLAALVFLFGCSGSNSVVPSTGAPQSASTSAASNAPSSNPAPSGNPSINFTAVGNMTEARATHVAVLLPNGKVLIAGGISKGIDPPPALASAELYDPSTRSFTPTGSMEAAFL